MVANNSQGSRVTLEVLLKVTETLAGFASWAATNLPENQRAQLDDPDNDGIPNIAEYAYGSNPNVAGSGRPHGLSMEVAGLNYAAVQFTRGTTATGVSIQVLASKTLAFTSAEPTTESVEPLGNGLERVTVRVTQPPGVAATLFFKISIVQR